MYPLPRSRWGTTFPGGGVLPSGGYYLQVEGYYLPGGVLPSQVGGTTFPGGWYYLPRWGVLPPGGGTTFPGGGYYFPRGTTFLGVLPSRRLLPPGGTTFPGGGTTFPGRGVSPSQAGGYPYQNSIACTCYGAGGMPLEFTQEDFLVLQLIFHSSELTDDFTILPIASCHEP